ncbi:hypothetical protein POM88_026130 [Heracleum sosnowskyi]|uniref:Uncharacterized protein n=1 Tax=Heracleum sosnowskyi TaxID=360622 RepID=A0AAD8I5C2_9APIA|nr:hypothetical protein POM88_026130 [Heracleum sosnowskyi]
MYGDRVKNWFTFNELRVVAARGFDDGNFPPQRCTKPYGNCLVGNSGMEPYIVTHNTILCHASAVQRYREMYQKTQEGRIGIVLDFVWYEPLTRGLTDEYAAQRARDFHLGWYLHHMVYGEYPKTMQNVVKDKLPKFSEEEVKMVTGSIDFLGINQYTANYIQHPVVNSSMPHGYQDDWQVTFVWTFLKAAENALKLEEKRSHIYKEVVAETEALSRNVHAKVITSTPMTPHDS